MSPRTPARQRLLDAASRLFYAQGMAATGIDAIIADAGVAKMSLYNNFSSKDDLVLAYIEARHQEWLGLYQRRAQLATTSEQKVLAVFDAYADHANAAYEHGFRGCGLLNAAAELPTRSPGRRRCDGTRNRWKGFSPSTWRKAGGLTRQPSPSTCLSFSKAR
ncbi:MAG: TetR/AcrR family transcriptional regulator [Tessaracoccus sp.]